MLRSVTRRSCPLLIYREAPTPTPIEGATSLTSFGVFPPPYVARAGFAGGPLPARGPPPLGGAFGAAEQATHFTGSPATSRGTQTRVHLRGSCTGSGSTEAVDVALVLARVPARAPHGVGGVMHATTALIRDRM